MSGGREDLETERECESNTVLSVCQMRDRRGERAGPFELGRNGRGSRVQSVSYVKALLLSVKAAIRCSPPVHRIAAPKNSSASAAHPRHHCRHRLPPKATATAATAAIAERRSSAERPRASLGGVL